MAIYKNNKKVIGVYKGTTPVLNIYRGGKLVFGGDNGSDDKEYQIIANADSEISSTTLYPLFINGEKYYYDCNKGINKWNITDFVTQPLTDLTRFISQTNFTDITLQNIDVSNVISADSMISSNIITGNVTLRNLSFDSIKSSVNRLINCSFIQSLRFENVNFPALDDFSTNTFISLNNLTDLYIDGQSFTDIDKSLFEGQHNYFMYKTNDTPLTIHCIQKFKDMIDSSTNKGGLGNYYSYITWDIIEEYVPKFNFSGKFTDDSTEEDWWYCANGSTSANNKISIADKVNPETKIFDFEFDLNNNLSSSKVTLHNLFNNNVKIEKIFALPSNEQLTKINSIFSGCTSLTYVNLDNFNFGNVTDFSSMFSRCTSLKTIKLNNVNTEKITTFYNMFSGCESLETINLNSFNTEKTTSFYNMFNACSSLKTINIGVWDMNNVNVVSYMFENCQSLTNIIGEIKNLKISIILGDIRFGSKLTNDSAMVFINGLSEDIEVTQTITFSPTTYDTLTPEQIAIATNKGWTVL